MSSSAIAWAFKRPLAGHAKLLLLVLADCADDDNRCTPHIRRLEAESGLARRTIIRLLGDLEDAGYLQGVRESGHATTYLLVGAPSRIPPAETRPARLVRGDQTRVNLAPVQPADEQTRAKLAPVPITTPTRANLAPVQAENGSLCSTYSEVREEQEKDIQRGGEAAAPLPAPAPQRGSVSTTGTRLPPNAGLPSAWRSWAIAQRKTIPQIDAMFEDFRDYWTAKPGASGRKVDWFATWRRWVRKQDEYRGAGGREAPPTRNDTRTPVWQSLGFESYDAWRHSLETAPPNWMQSPQGNTA